MLYPSIHEMMKNNTISRYSLVAATAKLARKMCDEAELHEQNLPDNPVRTAVHYLYNGIQNDTLRIIEPEDTTDNLR